MTFLRLLAPVPIDFYERLGTETAHRGEYAAFWEQAQSAKPTAGTLSVRRLHHRARANRYAVISADSLSRPLEAFHLALDPADVPDALSSCGVDVDNIRAIEASIFDHGIMMVSCELQISSLDADLSTIPKSLDTWQDLGVELCGKLSSEIHASIVVPLIEALRGNDRGARILAPERPPGTEAGLGHPLWVTRSLFVERSHEHAFAIITHWLKDVKDEESLLARTERLLSPGGDDHVMKWLNYLFVTDEIRTDFDDALGALQFAQYFYSALDCLDHRLAQVLAQAVSPDPGVPLAVLRDELQECSRRAQFVFMQMSDVAKYLTRAVKTEYTEILDFWEFEDVVVEAVRHKIAVCERRLDELTGQRTARATFFTDMILLAIGVTSILSTVLAFTDFGRSMATDPGMASYDTDRHRVVGWVSAQPVDTLLMCSGAISAVLILLYVHFRRSQRG